MPNGTYGGVRGKETKVGQKTFVSRPTRFLWTYVGRNLSDPSCGAGGTCSWRSKYAYIR